MAEVEAHLAQTRREGVFRRHVCSDEEPVQR